MTRYALYSTALILTLMVPTMTAHAETPVGTSTETNANVDTNVDVDTRSPAGLKAEGKTEADMNNNVEPGAGSSKGGVAADTEDGINADIEHSTGISADTDGAAGDLGAESSGGLRGGAKLSVE